MKIGIIGNGRFGSLLFKTLINKTKSTVLIYSIDSTFTYSSFAEVCNCDIVIPCVPISEFKAVIKQISPLIKKNALVIDVCSVKIFPTNIMLKILPKQVDILSTHPMFGPDSTKDGENFKGLNFIFFKTRITNNDRLNKVFKFLELLELTLVELSPDEHDKRAAFTQAFAFLIGKIGIKMNLRRNQISTKGFEGILYNQTMVENDTGILFMDMQNYNPYAKVMRKEVKRTLKQIEKELNNN